MKWLKKVFKKKDDPNRYKPVEREQYIRLGLATPPQNGYDDFLKLVWCRDMKDEARQQKQAEKEGKKDFQVQRKYYLCLVGIYEPYRENDPPVNLAKKGHSPLPKWTDDDHMEDILRNGYFFQNDAFILEKKYPQAIRPAEDYPYVEQYVQAYQHWNNGQKPTEDQKHEHKLSVATIILERLKRYEQEQGDGSSNAETIQKLKDIVESMDLEPEDRQECAKRIEEKKD